MRIVMMGTGMFAVPTFEALLAGSHPVVALITQPDRPAGQQTASTRQTGPSMADIAQKNGILLFQPESINTPEGVTGLRQFEPDLLVVAAYGQILSDEVLRVPPMGGMNVHASLLPRYRGAAPIAWAIYHGEIRTGVTIIRMSVHLDAGDILAQEAIDIGPEETAGELEARLAVIGARLAVQTVERLAQGPVSGIKQDRALATKAPKLTKEHGLIDWTRSATQIANHIRAMQPWPTAYTHRLRAGQPPIRTIIYKAVPHADRQATASPPGTLVSDPQRLFVTTGDGSVLEIFELQPAGKRRMAAAEYLRGNPVQLVDRFGAGP